MVFRGLYCGCGNLYILYNAVDVADIFHFAFYVCYKSRVISEFHIRFLFSTAVSQRSSQALSSAASNAQSISVVGPSNLEQSPLKLEEEITKRAT